MKKLKVHQIILLSIILLGLFLRLYKLASYPALNADEAAIGYNAYSLSQTGLDEHGNPWPIHFQSFKDDKPGLYIYLVLPFVHFFGLNNWSVRLPSAFLGVATIFVIYKLAAYLEKKNKMFPLSSAFLLAISPWHIHFSRGGWEVNVATFFISLGTLLFLKALRHPKLYVLSFISFVLSMYTYHSARVVVPLLGMALLVLNFKKIKKHFKSFALSTVLPFILMLPILFSVVGGSALSRAGGVSIFADIGVVNRINFQRAIHESPILGKVLHNKAVNYSIIFAQNWASHFSGEFLFTNGDEIQRNKVPQMGQLYFFEMLTIAAGLYFIFKSKDKSKWSVVFAWLLVAPAAAALTFQSPHALRAQNMIIPLVLVSAFGLSKILASKSKIFFGAVSLFILWNFAYYQNQYWLHLSKRYPFSSQYGVEELVDYLKTEEGNYDKIVVTDRYDQPYILFLYYLKYPPEVFQKEHELTRPDQYGFSTVRRFGKYEFVSINKDIIQPGVLYAGTDAEIDDNWDIIRQVIGQNGYKYFEVIKGHEKE